MNILYSWSAFSFSLLLLLCVLNCLKFLMRVYGSILLLFNRIFKSCLSYSEAVKRSITDCAKLFLVIRNCHAKYWPEYYFSWKTEPSITVKVCSLCQHIGVENRYHCNVNCTNLDLLVLEYMSLYLLLHIIYYCF